MENENGEPQYPYQPAGEPDPLRAPSIPPLPAAPSPAPVPPLAADQTQMMPPIGYDPPPGYAAYQPPAAAPSAPSAPATSILDSGPPVAAYPPPAGYGEPAAYGQASTYGQPTDYGQPSGYAQPSGFGQPTDYGQPADYRPEPSGYGQSVAYGQPADYGQSPAYGAAADPYAAAGYGAVASPIEPAYSDVRLPERRADGREAKNSHVGRWTIAVIAVVIVAIAAAVLLIKPSFLFKKVLDHKAVEQTIESQSNGLLTNISCPDNEEVKAGATFQCSTADGQKIKVTITNSKADYTWLPVS